MFQRDIYLRLQEWAKKSHRKPLVLRGARQVGKTTLVNEFKLINLPFYYIAALPRILDKEVNG